MLNQTTSTLPFRARGEIDVASAEAFEQALLRLRGNPPQPSRCGLFAAA
jgi:hypothetical protein